MKKISKKISGIYLSVCLFLVSSPSFAALAVVTKIWEQFIVFMKGVYPPLAGIMILFAGWQMLTNSDHGKRNALGSIIGLVILGVAIYDNAEIAKIFSGF